MVCFLQYNIIITNFDKRQFGGFLVHVSFTDFDLKIKISTRLTTYFDF